MGLLWFGMAVALGFAGSWAFYPALRLGRRGRLAVLLPTAAVVGWVPLLVPPERRFIRWLSAVAIVMAWLKMYDLHVGASLGRRVGPGRFAIAMVTPISFVERSPSSRFRPPAGHDLRLLARRLPLAICGAAAFVLALRVDWSGLPFLAEHAAKSAALALVLVPATNAWSSIVRLGGGSGIDIMDNPLASRTPADFWRRYNRPVNRFFREDIFIPSGGIRKPNRGTLLVFAASAFIHEYVFAVPIGAVQGYQSAYFAVQGAAVLATARVRPRGRLVPLCVAGTSVLNLLTGVLFFASLEQVVPLYQRGMPAWLAPREGRDEASSIGRNQRANSSSTDRVRIAFAARAAASPGAIRAIPPTYTFQPIDQVSGATIAAAARAVSVSKTTCGSQALKAVQLNEASPRRGRREGRPERPPAPPSTRNEPRERLRGWKNALYRQSLCSAIIAQPIAVAAPAAVHPRSPVRAASP